MKATGIVRNVDELGRIVIPKEMRKKMDIKNEDALEIYVEEDRIILKKYVPACIFCGGDRDVSLFKDRRVCRNCLEQIRAL